MNARVHRLPLPLRGGRAAPAFIARRVGDLLAERLLREDTPYRGTEQLVLRIDPGDPFQRAMLLGRFDRVLSAIIDRWVPRGGTVLDCGGHIGYVALLFARAVGPGGSVHSFEPDARLAPRIREHAALNGVSWLRVNETAVTDRTGDKLTLAVTDQLGWASVGVDVWQAEHSTTVLGVAIDDYVSERGLDPAFIKLDVEGAEGDALRGMERTLNVHSAPLLIEWIPWRIEANGDDPQELLALLRRCGYAPHVPILKGARLTVHPGEHPEQGDDVLFLKD